MISKNPEFKNFLFHKIFQIFSINYKNINMEWIFLTVIKKGKFVYTGVVVAQKVRSVFLPPESPGSNPANPKKIVSSPLQFSKPFD